MASHTITEPTGECAAVFILLHDYLSSGEILNNQLASLLGDSPLGELLPQARLICMDAPHRARTRSIHGAPEWTRLWFEQKDGKRSTWPTATQWDHIAESIRGVKREVEKAVEEVGSDNVFLVGVGQGCGIAVLTLLALDTTIAAVFGFQGRLDFHAGFIIASGHGEAWADQTNGTRKRRRLRALKKYVRSKVDGDGDVDGTPNAYTPVILCRGGPDNAMNDGQPD